MLKDTIIGFASDIGLNAVKEKLTSIHDTREIKKDIMDFADSEFEARFKHLSFTNEIDYDGLKSYLTDNLIDDIKVYLFDTDQTIRSMCRQSIIEKSCYYANADNANKKDEVTHFIEAVLTISEKYYIDKLDGQYRLLQNITIETLLASLCSAKNEILRGIEQIHTQLLELVAKDNFDKEEVNTAINMYFNEGDFTAIITLLKVINREAKDIIMSINAKLSCFTGDLKKDEYIDEFIAQNPDCYFVDDLISFFCVFSQCKSDISKLVPYCKNQGLSDLARLIISDKCSALYVEEKKDAVLQFRMKDEYKEYDIAKILIANDIMKREFIINKNELYDLLTKSYNNFYLHFKQLALLLNDILAKKDYELNQKHQNEIEIILDKMLQMEKSFEFCSNEYQFEYYSAVLPALATCRPLEFPSSFLALSEDLKNKEDLKKLQITHAIANNIDLDEKETIDFCIKYEQYDVLHQYLISIINDYQTIKDILNDYIFVLKKDFTLLDLFIFCVYRTSSQDEALKELLKYKEYYKDSSCFYCLCLELSGENETEGITVDKMVTLLLNEKGILLHMVSRITIILRQYNKVEIAIDFLRKLKYYGYSFMFLLAELLYESQLDSNISEAKSIINELIDAGYENDKIFELKASILLDQGFQLEAIRTLEKSYKLNNCNLNVLANLLGGRLNNSQCIDDEILLNSKTIENEQIQFLVAINYSQLGNKELHNFHLKKSLLLCDDYNEQSFHAFMKSRLLGNIDDIKVDYDIVRENTTVYLKNITTDEIIVWCIHADSNIIPRCGSSFGNAIHFSIRDKNVALLIRRKINECVRIADINYEIVGILNIDAFFAKHCISKSLDSGLIKSMQMDIDNPKPAFDELHKIVLEGNKHRSKITEMYTSPENHIPVSINMLATAVSKSYINTLLYITLRTDIIVKSNPFQFEIHENDKVLLTYNTFVFLGLLDIGYEILSKKNNLYATLSTKNRIHSEFDDNIAHLNRDNVMSMTSIEDKLATIVYSEEDKRISIEFNSEIASLLEAVTVLNNENDIEIEHIGKTDNKLAIGIFEYDSIALFNDEKTVIVTDDCFLACFINNIENILSNTCGIIDLLIYLDVGIEAFLKALLKLKSYSCSVPISAHAIEYITENFKKINDNNQGIALLKLLDEFFILPIDNTYRDVFIFNSIHILQSYFNGIYISKPISQLVYDRLIKIAYDYFNGRQIR